MTATADGRRPTVPGQGGAGRGSLRRYATGFVLSVVLTAIAFVLVLYGSWSRADTVAAILAAAVVQILVHLHFFLHLDASSKARWNVLALLFAVLIMVLIVGGTLWIMLHLQVRLS
jgi:cytochrome o ubiquinol oxidase subunit IV